MNIPNSSIPTFSEAASGVPTNMDTLTRKRENAIDSMPAKRPVLPAGTNQRKILSESTSVDRNKNILGGKNNV